MEIALDCVNRLFLKREDVTSHPEWTVSMAPTQALSRNEHMLALKNTTGKDFSVLAPGIAGSINPSATMFTVPNYALSTQTTGLERDAPPGQSGSAGAADADPVLGTSEPNGGPAAPVSTHNRQLKSGIRKV